MVSSVQAETRPSGAPIPNARITIIGEVIPPPTDSINHCAPMIAVSGAPTTASASGSFKRITSTTPNSANPTKINDVARRRGAPIFSRWWS